MYIYIYIHIYIFKAPGSRPLKDNSKFEILLKFSLKQKVNQILPATIEITKFCFFKKTVYGSLKQGITIWKSKTKAIQADLGILTHIPAYSGMFRHINA